MPSCPPLPLPPAAASFSPPTPSRTATRDWQQLQPLVCPVGFRNATGEADNSILWAMLWQFFGNQAVSDLASGWLADWLVAGAPVSSRQLPPVAPPPKRTPPTAAALLAPPLPAPAEDDPRAGSRPGLGQLLPQRLCLPHHWRLGGCLETAARKTPAAFSQGVITYTCYRQAKVQTVGLTLSGTYGQGCKLPATISLGQGPV